MNRTLGIYIAGGLTAIVAWFFLLQAPLNREHTELVEKSDSAQQQLSDVQEAMVELPRFVTGRKALELLRTSQASHLYAKEDILDLLSVLRDEAARWDLTITEITPPVDELLALNRIVPEAGQPQYLNLSLKLRGSYIQFGKYVAYIEQAGFFRGLNRCAVWSQPDESTDLVLHVGFKALLSSGTEPS